MSWLFSRALVEEFSEATCSAGEPSAPLSVMPTQHKFWHKGKTIESYDLSRFGLTCVPLTEDHGAGLLTSFLAAFHARTSASQAAETASTGSEAACGQRWPGLLAKYDHGSCSWKTAQPSLLGGSDEFSETWPRSGMTRTGMSYLRRTLELRTYANGCGLWPTPVASDTGSRSTKYNQGGTPLSLAVKLWPTPTAGNSKSGGYLAEWGGSRSREKMASMAPESDMFGPLNPEWVEWLMGWPIGWTDLRPLEMDRFREWQQQHGIFSGDERARTQGETE